MGAEVWSAVAAGCSALAAIVSLVVAWNAKQIQGRSADFANCIEVAGQLRDAMRRVRDELDKLNKDDNEARYKFELVELLNLLEALALLHNDGRIAASTKKFTGKFLIQVLAWISIDDGMAEIMRKSMTDDDTYLELEVFRKHHEPEIRELSRKYRNKRDTQP